MSVKNSWSNEDLRQLKEIKNHLIKYDGYEYYWMRNLNDKWETHFIKNFETRDKAYSYLMYNIGKWEKEFSNRIVKPRNELLLKQQKEKLEIEFITYEIAQSQIKTKEKICRIKNINDEVSVKELSELLDLQTSIVHRHIRNLEKSTLLYA